MSRELLLLLLVLGYSSLVSSSCSLNNGTALLCSGDVSNLLTFDRELLVRVSELRVEECESVMLVDGFFRFFKNLKSIHIRCAETNVESGSLESLSGAVPFLSVGNAIRCFVRKTFCPLKLTGVLDLSHNRLSGDDDFGLLTNCSSYRWAGRCGNSIIQLLVSDNNLTSLNKEGFLCSLENLEGLDVSGNALARVESGTFNAVKKLRSLNLGRNFLSELHEQIFDRLHELRSLELRDNRLTALPKTIFKNQNQLIFLDLSQNRIKNVNARFRNLGNLVTLNLSENQVRFTDASDLMGLTNLLSLNLSANALTSVAHTAFAGSPRLLNLDLSGNNLSFTLKRQSFIGLGNLESFNLSRNRLIEFEFTWFPQSLFSLDLSYNRIRRLPSFDSPAASRLKTLELSGNLIDQLPRDRLPPTLRRLFLANNRISLVSPGAFEKTNRLSFLSLRNNSLNVLSVLPESLVAVELNGNPWSCEWTFETDFWSFVRAYKHVITDAMDMYCVGPSNADSAFITSDGSIHFSHLLSLFFPLVIIVVKFN